MWRRVYCHYTDRGAERFSNNGCHVSKRGELNFPEMVPYRWGSGSRRMMALGIASQLTRETESTN